MRLPGLVWINMVYSLQCGRDPLPLGILLPTPEINWHCVSKRLAVKLVCTGLCPSERQPTVYPTPSMLQDSRGQMFKESAVTRRSLMWKNDQMWLLYLKTERILMAVLRVIFVEFGEQLEAKDWIMEKNNHGGWGSGIGVESNQSLGSERFGLGFILF